MSTTETWRDQERNHGQFGPRLHPEADIDLMPSGDWNPEDFDSAQARAKAMLEDLSTAVEKMVASGQLRTWMDSLRANGLNRWSFNNASLALMQLLARRQAEGLSGLPEDKAQIHFNSFNQWKKLGRHPRKGEKAMYILRPLAIVRKDETGQPMTDDEGNVLAFTMFKPFPVFNIDQTEGKDLPEPPPSPLAGTDTEVAPEAIDGLRERIKGQGYDYREQLIQDFDPATGMGTHGYTRNDVGAVEVVIDERLSGAHKLSVMAHELAHIRCGHVKDYSEYAKHRGQMETEAEMTAYLVSRDLGVNTEEDETFSSAYIASWSGGDKAKMTRAMGNAVKAYRDIMAGPWGLETDTENEESTA